MSTKPVLGAALNRASRSLHRDWLLEAQRDVELQHFVDVEVLHSDRSALAAEVMGLPDGHAGWRGIHGPFWGFSIASFGPEVRGGHGFTYCDLLTLYHMGLLPSRPLSFGR
jgi:hypothetical protein